MERGVLVCSGLFACLSLVTADAALLRSASALWHAALSLSQTQSLPTLGSLWLYIQ